MMSAVARQPIPVVVHQHAEESAMLRHVRSVLVRAPHVKLHQLGRLDERIAAHLDGLAVAGSYGAACCTAALANPGAGEVFAAAVCAIESRDDAALDRLFAIAGALPDAKRGLLSAFGWVSAPQLQGIARTLLASPDALRREIGIAACRLHHADPGPVLASAMCDPHPPLRAAAVRAAGELGRGDLMAPVLAALGDDDEEVAVRAAWSACLLGNRDASLEGLALAAQRQDAHAEPALGLLLQAQEFTRAQGYVRLIAKDVSTPVLERRRIKACGWLGDPQVVPWLIELMTDDRLARLAGESFTFITGADLAALDLERKPPDGFEAGPNDNPEDDNVALDEDESLPWPDRDRVHCWWQAHAARMPAGVRHFLGAPTTPEQCTRVLREGFQRQRIAAARWLCLLSPGSMLFATGAPAWRQQRRLAPGA